MKPLSVYLSSTFEDLKEHREAVFGALEKAGLQVTRMESYTASDERPLDLCLRDVAGSDVYVGIFAWRYGYEPPAEHGNLDGRSITELEYRQAERAGHRKLLFFAHPDTREEWPQRFRDDVTGAGDRGDKLTRFRKELATEKAISFFRTKEELAVLVLAALMRSGMSGRPYDAPPLPSGLVARPHLHAAAVKALLETHTLVQGAGGFGKSTLAIEICHTAEVLRAFPDGILWTSLGTAPDLGQVLGNLYVAATGRGPTVVGKDAIRQALADALKGRHCLVVIDDVWRADDLRPFLQLEGPRLLVTTRHRNLIPRALQSNWAEVLVDEMVAHEAAAVLGRGLTLDDDSPHALQDLALRLGCWPLLLDLVNARLREEQDSRRCPAAECIRLVVRLLETYGVLGFDQRDSEERNTAVARSVDAGLELAERMFPGLARKAAEISAFPENVPIPVQVLSDLWAMKGLDVEEMVLRPLDNLSLLRWDRPGMQIQLHMIIDRALEARMEMSAGGLAAVHRRLLDAWGDPHRLPHAYAWRWFGWHCVSANEPSRLLQLLSDLGWLRAKLEATDIQALLDDFQLVPGHPEAEVLQSALRLSAHVLARDTSKLAGQLLARLPQRDALRDRILEQACTSRDPWLRPLRPSLTLPGGPLLRTMTAHMDYITAVAVTPDARHAVSASADGTAIVWELETGQPVQTFSEHEQGITALALARDGVRAMSASQDGRILVWDVEHALLLHAFQGHEGRVAALALAADGVRAVSGGFDGTLVVWDLEGATAVRRIDRAHADAIWHVGLTADGTHAVSLGRDDSLRVWDVDHNGAPVELERHVSSSRRALAVDGERVISEGPNWALTVWGLNQAVPRQQLEGHTRGLTAIVLTRDGKRAVSASYDTTLRVWDLERGEALHTLTGHSEPVFDVAIAEDGRLAVSASGDRTLKVWDLEQGTLLQTLEGHSDQIEYVALTPDGTRAVSGGGDHTLKVWDLGHLESHDKPEGHSRWIWRVAMSPDGATAVSASDDSTLKVWDVRRGEVLRTLQGHTERVRDVAITPDGRRAVSAGWDATLRVWDLASGEQLHLLRGHTGDAVGRVVVTSDGKRAVSAAWEPSLRVWDLGDGTELCALEGHTRRVRDVALTADGTHAVSASEDGTVKLWDIDRGVELHTFAGHDDWVCAVAVTPDGTRAVSASQDQTLKVWDLERRVELLTLAGHTAWVSAVTLTQDGRRAISASQDGTVRIWDLASGEAIRVLDGHNDRVNDIALTVDGRRMVSASYDRSVAVWDLATGARVASFDTDSFVQTVATVDGRVFVAGDAQGRMHFLSLENPS